MSVETEQADALKLLAGIRDAKLAELRAAVCAMFPNQPGAQMAALHLVEKVRRGEVPHLRLNVM